MNDRFLPSRSGGTALVPSDHSMLAAPMAEQGWYDAPALTLSTFLDALYRWRWMFLAIVLLVVLAAAAWASLQTPLYRATASLELNPAPTRIGAPEESQIRERPLYDADFLELQLSLINSRSVAERVSRNTGLPLGQVMGSFTASGGKSDRIMYVSAVHPDPAVAANLANAFAEAAIESNFDRALDATARSRKFLQGRLEATKRELEKSERALVDYARQANIINVVGGENPTSGDSAGGTLVASNLVALNQQLADAQNARIVAQQRYAQASAAAQAAQASDSTVQSLQQQRAQLQAEYDQKLQTFKPEFPEMQSLQARIAGLDRQIAASGSRASSAVVASLRAEMVAAQNRERALEARIRQLQSQFLDLNDRGVQYTILKRSVDANRSLYNALLEQLGAENSSGTRTAGISIIDRAQVPGGPFSPDIPRTLMFALLAGLALGSAGVFGADRFYDTVNTPDDLKALGLAVLGVVPAAQGKQSADELIAEPGSPIAEAYHSTRASLQFASAGGTPQSILFTSASAAEGKTSAAIAIAADFVSIGKNVVVVDADLRRPSLRGDSPGLSGVLAGASTLEQSLLREHPRLSLLPAGRIPPNPTALLTGMVIDDLVRTLERRFDVVIIDAPPVMGFADSPLLSGIAQATVLVVASGSTSRSLARNAVARLQTAGGNLVGGILNKFNRKSAAFSYASAGYGYEYGAERNAPKRSLIAPPATDIKEAAE